MSILSTRKPRRALVELAALAAPAALLATSAAPASAECYHPDCRPSILDGVSNRDHDYSAFCTRVTLRPPGPGSPDGNCNDVLGVSAPWAGGSHRGR